MDGGPKTDRSVDHEVGVIVGLRPIATPLPLTFAGLVIASVVISGYELGWIPPDQHRSAGLVLLAIPVPLQLLAAWWGFAARSPTAATGSALLAAAWLAIGFDLLSMPTPSKAVGVLAFAVAGVLAIPALAEMHAGSALPAAVLGAAAARFALTGAAAFVGTGSWTHVSGWAGIAVAGIAFYAALAFELEGTGAQRPLLPTFRLGRAHAATSSPLREQIEGLEHEPGIRPTL